MSMQRIPIHNGETKTFTPDILRDEIDPPVFTFRAVSRLRREEMEHAQIAAGLAQHSKEEFRAAHVEELCRLWGCDEEHENIVRLKAYWQSMDDYESEATNLEIEKQAAIAAGEEPPSALAPYSHPDERDVDELLKRVNDQSPRIRKMLVDNIAFQRNFYRFTLQYALAGWAGINTPFKCWDNTPEFETVVDMQVELEERFPEKGRLAWMQLGAEASQMFYLSKGAEKNSASPAPSPQTQPPTKATGRESRSGKSQASGTSKAIPAS